jgi:hypothetical protein
MECSNCKTLYFANKGYGAVIYRSEKPYCCPCVAHCLKPGVLELSQG